MKAAVKREVDKGWGNRLLEVLRAILRRCVNEWEWLDRAPYVKMFKEPTRRIRHTDMRQVAEPVLVQTLVPESTVETLDVSVLVGFSRLNQKQIHASCMRPGYEYFAKSIFLSHFSPIVSPLKVQPMITTTTNYR